MSEMDTPQPLYGAKQSPAVFSPLAESQRHELIDAVRGFAILGIFLVNMIGFKTPFIATSAIGGLWHSGLANQWTLVAIDVFAAHKFFPIFSLVFGIGMALQYRRSQAVERPFRGFFFRRMLVLLVLGVLHGVLLWAGDILAIYALCGIFGLIFIGRRPLVLAGWAVGFFLFSLLSIGGLIYMHAALGDDTEWWLRMGEWWFEAYSKGSWDEILLARLAEWGMMWISAISYFVSFVFSFILLGMIIGSTGTLDRLDQWRPRLFFFAATGIPCGILLNGIWVAEAVGQPMTLGVYVLAYIASFVGSAWLSLSYLTCLYFLVTSRKVRWLVTRLTAVGRLALTHYLLQSIVANAIFMSWGFGMYGQVEAQVGVLIVLTVFAFQLLVSPWWLRHFAIGPFEWLWRTLAYGHAPPFRRKAAEREKRE